MRKLAFVLLLLLFVSLTLSGQAQKRKTPTRKKTVDFSEKKESPCGVRQSIDEFIEEMRIEWRVATTAKDETKYYYNTQNIVCDPSGILKVWIKIVNKESILTGKQRLELKCRDNQFRITTSIEYDKDGEVTNSRTSRNSEWQDVVPDSIGEDTLQTVCHSHL